MARKNKKHLYRSRQDRIIAGVCGGIAEYFGIDPVWTRLAAILLVFVKGFGILLYIILWVITPKNPKQKDVNDDKISETIAGKVSLTIEKKAKEEIKCNKKTKKESRKAEKRSRTVESSGNSPSKKVLITIAVILFNLIFVVGIFFGLLGVLIGLFAAGLSIAVAGVVTFVASIISISGSELFSLGVHPSAGIFISIGVTALGLLFLIGDWYIAKLFCFVTSKYARFNYRLISGRRD